MGCCQQEDVIEKVQDCMAEGWDMARDVLLDCDISGLYTRMPYPVV